ncbi:hypothetical protein PTKIN_Ptkin12aG0213000 [Pterospermum kingtungense]
MSNDILTGDRPGNRWIGKYHILGGLDNQFDICFEQNRTSGNTTHWQASNPLLQLLPNFMLQLGIIILLTRVFMFILKPVHQPRFVSEILVGIVLGPSLLSRREWISVHINPFEGTLVLETMGNLGVTFYMFLVGLEMDVTPLQRMGIKAFSVAIAGIIVPGLAGMGLYQILKNHKKNVPSGGGIFWAIALTVTSFSDLARMLSNLKLMYTDLGKTALTSAILTDLASWSLLVIAVSLKTESSRLANVIATVIFVFISLAVIRPIILWTINRTTAGEESSIQGQLSDKFVCFILTSVLLCGFLTELCGVHSMFGAFMLGLMMPSGELGTKMMDKIEAFIVGILLPPVFLIAGLRTNIRYILSGYYLGFVIIVIVVACFIKIITTLLVGLYLKSPFRDSLALGVLMNTKGVMAIIVLNEGRSAQVFNQQAFTWMMVSILIMTASVGPIVGYTHRSMRHLKQHHPRNLERSKPEEELRVLACLHSSRNLSGLISLLHFSNATKSSPITVFAVHLVELTGRASAMLIFHDKNRMNNVIGNNNPNPTREQAEAEQIISAFQSLQRENDAAIVQLLTAVSSYPTMHEDVSNFALDKRVTVILLPFHKKPNGLGGWTDENMQHKQVCENLLEDAPCSIGILVDRGLTRHLPLESHHDRMRKCRIAMIFVQGPDDREALAYARRMAGHPGVVVTVLRFVPGKELLKLEERALGNADAHDDNDDDNDDSEVFSTMFEKEKEKLLDDDYINEFRFRTMHDHSFNYIEKPVNSGDQIVLIIRSAYNDFDLYIVGRGYGMQSPLTYGLSEWNDCPELGVVGETLASADFLTSSGSVLVMQQSAPTPANVSKKNMSSNSKKVEMESQ